MLRAEQYSQKIKWIPLCKIRASILIPSTLQSFTIIRVKITKSAHKLILIVIKWKYGKHIAGARAQWICLPFSPFLVVRCFFFSSLIFISFPFAMLSLCWYIFGLSILYGAYRYGYMYSMRLKLSVGTFRCDSDFMSSQSVVGSVQEKYDSVYVRYQQKFMCMCVGVGVNVWGARRRLVSLYQCMR